MHREHRWLCSWLCSWHVDGAGEITKARAEEFVFDEIEMDFEEQKSLFLMKSRWMFKKDNKTKENAAALLEEIPNDLRISEKCIEHEKLLAPLRRHIGRKVEVVEKRGKSCPPLCQKLKLVATREV